MAIEPTIVVVGATGQQGGGCVDALLQQGKFKIKAVTRDLSSDAAKALKKRNVDVVTANLSDKESLVKAFTGAHGVFLVTDFAKGAGGKAETEIQHGKNAVDAAQQASVKHLVWSALEDPRPIIKGALPESAPGRVLSHFESKSDITEYLKQSSVPHTILETSIFYENALGYYQYRKQQDGSLAFALNGGTKPHPNCAVGDIGASATVVFDSGTSLIGATIPVVGEHISFARLAEVIGQVTGKTVQYQEMTRDQMAALPFPGAAEMANMFQYYNDFPNFADRRPVNKAVVKGNTFQKWAEEHSDALKAAVGSAQ